MSFLKITVRFLEVVHVFVGVHITALHCASADELEQGARKWALSLGSPHFVKLQFVSFGARQPQQSCQAAEFFLFYFFCRVMGSMAGLCSKEKPNWLVFSIVAKSCHHNKVRPWSCCRDPTKHTTERFMQVHRRTKQTLSFSSFCFGCLHLFPLCMSPHHLHLDVFSVGFVSSNRCRFFSHLSWLTTQSLCL